MSFPSNVISGSVGFGGSNRKSDVQLIQSMLNAVPFPKGGPNPLLGVDGLCGPKTSGAISRFQHYPASRFISRQGLAAAA